MRKRGIPMAHILVSRKRARALSAALFLLGLAAVSLSGNWWPELMLVIGVPLALRQYLLGRSYDMLVSLLIFGGTYVLIKFKLPWDIFLPTIFIIGALYILCREFVESKEKTEEEVEEDLNHEIEENKDDKEKK